MSFTYKIGSADIQRIDQGDMTGHISKMGDHIRESIALTSSALDGVKFTTDISSIAVLGMGGSAIGGDFIRSYLAGSLKVPIFVNRYYDLPTFADSKTLVIASSYSGNTEETLSAFEQAVEKKLPLICISTGGKLSERAKQLGLKVIPQRAGMQPRAAFAYSFVPILLILEKLGLTSGEAQNLEQAATFLDSLVERYGTAHFDNNNLAYRLAGELIHRIPVIYSASDYDAVGLRWRGQIQENAKHVAFGNVVPEMNHNELNGWAHPADMVQHFSVLFLRSGADEHPRVAKRFAVMKEILMGKQADVTEVVAEGPNRLERLLSLVSLADWTSLYMALFAGIDPTTIPSIDLLKEKLK